MYCINFLTTLLLCTTSLHYLWHIQEFLAGTSSTEASSIIICASLAEQGASPHCALPNRGTRLQEVGEYGRKEY
ncbi:hypothetical protein C8Q69DRAFT_463121, partial [Paecilomyces variotii]